MHREIDVTANPFDRPPMAGLYLLTLLATSLFLVDVATPLLNLAASFGVETNLSLPREIYGMRLALLAAIIGGARSLYSGLDRLLEGKLGADLAIVLAAAAAIALNEPVVAAEVVVIGLIGECLEAFTFDRAQRSLDKLAELFPTRCWRINPDGVEERIFTTQLAVDDRVVVKPGGKIPADGIVTAGHAAVDQSLLTGESVPVERGIGDTVLAGTLVPTGSLTFRVTKVAGQSVAGQIVALTGKALAVKGQGERLADRLARYFLPVVLAVTLLTFAFNIALVYANTKPDVPKIGFSAAARLAAYPSLAVLVVACPCPLVLATPAAVVAALGRLAGTGVLLKSGAALERLATTQAFAFDKTGTLTLGALEVAQIAPADGVSQDELLRIIVDAESKSEHPIATAILIKAIDRAIYPEDCETFEAVPGAGVRAKLKSGEIVLVGSPGFLRREGIAFTEITNDEGLTLVAAARDGVYLGWLGLRDTLRPEAVGVVSDLSALGLSPLAVLSGDTPAAVHGTLGNVPGLQLYGGLLPHEKAAWLKQQEKPTAFLGDGINDAPALATAHVGLAVGTGADLAAATGEVVLLGEPLRSLPFLIRLSREAVKIIRFNIIGFGFVLNMIGVVLTGWLWPLFAPSAAWFENAPLAGAIFHQLGSLLVLLNSMRLLGFERAAESSFIRQVVDTGRALDRNLTRWNFDELLHEAGHHWKKITFGVFLLAVLSWLATSIVTVGTTEVAVVQRFGSIEAQLPPGLHVRLPWPIETAMRFKPAEVRTVEIGFRLLPEDRLQSLERAAADQAKLRGTESASLTWGSAHAGAIVPKSDESLLITGDGNLVELFATVRYRIAEPREYVARGRDVDVLLRSSAETAFRELAASSAFQDMLTTGRQEFERRAAERFLRRWQQAVPESIGIEVLGLTVHDLHPPQEVVSAFHAVAEAIQKRDREVNLAEANTFHIRRTALQEANTLLNATVAENTNKIADAVAARDVFLAWAKARRELPAAAEAALMQEQQRRIAAGEDRAKVEAEIQMSRAAQQETRRTLTEFRLMLDAITVTLRSRDKILIDADTLPGKRHVLLMDPDSPGARLPAISLPRPENPTP